MWTLHEGDCLEVMRGMAAGSVDAIITDPPYSSGGLMRGDRMADPVRKYVQSGTQRVDLTFSGDNRDQRSWTVWMTMWMLQAGRLLRVGGRVYLFTDWRQLPATTDAVQAAGFIWRGIIAWDKGRGARAAHTGFHRHQCEYVVFATHGPAERADGRGPFDGCIHATIPRNKLHPTQKPVEVMTPLVRCVEAGGTILDPFAGSGTTLLAAVAEGRNAIGIERESPYCEIIRRRMAAAEGPLLLAAP